MGRVLRAGIYARISDDREGAGLGVDRQEQDCRKLAKDLGWRVVEIYCDNDISAYSGKRRDGYERMLDDLRNEHIDALLVWHNDRLHRSPKELESFIDLVTQHGTQIHSVRGGKFDLSTPEGRLFARQLGSFARYESEHKSDRIKRKVEQLIEQGKVHNGGARPYGFDRAFAGEGPRRKILGDTVNPEEAANIREWARRALEGEKLYALMGDINKAGILSSTGRPWSMQALRTLLISGRIAGLKEHHRQVVGKAEWDAIISEEEHRQLRALLENPGRYSGGLRGVRQYPLSGLVLCTCKDGTKNTNGEQIPLTKMKVTKHSQSGRHVYTCTPKKAGGCGGRAIKLKELEDHVFALLMALLEGIEAGEQDPEADHEQAALEAKLMGYETRKNALAEEYAEGDHSPKEYRSAVAIIDRKMDEVSGELARFAVRSRIDQSAAELRQSWDDPDFPLARKRSTVLAYIQEIKIHPATRPYNVFNPDRIEVIWR